jgi:hypothetical protein
VPIPRALQHEALTHQASEDAMRRPFVELAAPARSRKPHPNGRATRRPSPRRRALDALGSVSLVSGTALPLPVKFSHCKGLSASQAPAIVPCARAPRIGATDTLLRGDPMTALSAEKQWAKHDLHGHLVVLTTPFHDDLSIDYDAFRANVQKTRDLRCVTGYYVNSIFNEATR